MGYRVVEHLQRLRDQKEQNGKEITSEAKAAHTGDNWVTYEGHNPIPTLTA